ASLRPAPTRRVCWETRPELSGPLPRSNCTATYHLQTRRNLTIMPKEKNTDLRQPAEILFAEELDALVKAEKHPVPAGWRMSPRSVLTYICGGECGKLDITPKYIGHQRLVEIAISTLVTDRALLLIGEPGTAKSWLSEHLAAAINGDSTKVVQG